MLQSPEANYELSKTPNTTLSWQRAGCPPAVLSQYYFHLHSPGSVPCLPGLEIHTLRPISITSRRSQGSLGIKPTGGSEFTKRITFPVSQTDGVGAGTLLFRNVNGGTTEVEKCDVKTPFTGLWEQPAASAEIPAWGRCSGCPEAEPRPLGAAGPVGVSDPPATKPQQQLH